MLNRIIYYFIRNLLFEMELAKGIKWKKIIKTQSQNMNNEQVHVSNFTAPTDYQKYVLLLFVFVSFSSFGSCSSWISDRWVACIEPNNMYDYMLCRMSEYLLIICKCLYSFWSLLFHWVGSASTFKIQCDNRFGFFMFRTSRKKETGQLI